MGETPAHKVTEIHEARQRLELDLRELEERLPAALRSAKSVVGVLVGTGVMAMLLTRLVRRRSNRTPKAEVVVRIVRDDEAPVSASRRRPRRSKRRVNDDLSDPLIE
jgi:hypothetical protein